MAGERGSGEEGEGGDAVLPSFERLHPARFVVLSFPNPTFPSDSDAELLRVAVLDSPSPAPAQTTAAMLLLLASSASRLVLVGNVPIDDSPPPVYTRRQSLSPPQLEQILHPLLLALSPRFAFEGGTLPSVPFLCYEDGVIRSNVVEIAAGPVAGEMVVEDVEIELSVESANPLGSSSPPPVRRERRRRLRFKRMPNLVQTQMRLLPDTAAGPYLVQMVAGLLLAGPLIDRKTQLGLRPRALCLGVGGGALLTFLESRLGFDVFGVEADEVVLGAAKRHFGLVEGEFLSVTVGDGIGLLLEDGFSRELCAAESGSADALVPQGRWLHRRQRFLNGGVDVIMVDLDAEDPASGAMAPPPEFVKKAVISSVRSVLREQGGLLVINAIPPNAPLRDALVGYLREEFSELYEIDVGNGENLVLLATLSTLASVGGRRDGPFADNLRQILGTGTGMPSGGSEGRWRTRVLPAEVRIYWRQRAARPRSTHAADQVAAPLPLPPLRFYSARLLTSGRKRMPYQGDEVMFPWGPRSGFTESKPRVALSLPSPLHGGLPYAIQSRTPPWKRKERGKYRRREMYKRRTEGSKRGVYAL
ncbi:unnamed protein product [Spirodela intermedia]|uniref:Uncharacterized protein n=1 Tax=Spirodela intermedia TaxID=51605 RepID=A0A7I8JEF8_SPIIN|nr:unnamed protein product [Spirodela intermedia]CAA6668530.1 unnamed protein product [Spirodela intermedia]